MHLENFDPSAMERALAAAATSVETLSEISFVYAQHRRFLLPAERSALDTALQESILKDNPETSLAWVDAIYDCLGAQGRATLERHELDVHAPPESRDTCGLKISQLKHEEQLPLVATSAPTPSWSPLKSSLVIQPQDLNQAIMEHGQLAEDAKNHGFAPVAAPDCDGTLWYGDIGDLFFERALAERWLQPDCSAPLNQLCDRYGIRVHKNVNDTAKNMMDNRVDGSFMKAANQLGIGKNDAYREFYSTQALCMAGLSVGFIKARAYEIMNEAGGLKERIFPEVKSVLMHLADAGFIVVPISASLNLLVEVGVTFLGIPGRRAMGVTVPHHEGYLKAEMIEPMPYGPGKITLISQLGGLPPAVALGDSWQRTDKELLEGAGLGLVIVHGEPPEDLTPGLHCLKTAIP